MTEPVPVFVVDDNSCDVQLTLQGFKEFHSTFHRLPFCFRWRAGNSPNPGWLSAPVHPARLNLPRIDGPAFLAWLHARGDLNPRPTVVLFRLQSRARMSRMLELGAAAFMAKPLDLDSYFETIKNVINHWIGPLANEA